MSADNGVFISRWKKGNSFEYRIAHLQAIENCSLDNTYTKELTDAYRVLYFGSCEVLKNEKDALREASKIYDEIMNDDSGFPPVCEYGICKVNYDVEFPKMTIKEADEYLTSFFAYTNDNIDVDMRLVNND